MNIRREKGNIHSLRGGGRDYDGNFNPYREGYYDQPYNSQDRTVNSEQGRGRGKQGLQS